MFSRVFPYSSAPVRVLMNGDLMPRDLHICNLEKQYTVDDEDVCAGNAGEV